MKLRLFRGIALSEKDAENVIEDIIQNGIVDISPNSMFQPEIIDIKAQLSKFVEISNFTLEDIISSDECVKRKGAYFADIRGATHYAKNHNKTSEKTVSVLIEIEVDINDVVIDGRDFLFFCFSNINKTDKNKQEEQKNKMVALFGQNILVYIDKFIESDNRNALYELMIQDNKVIMEHYQNQVIIGGRYNTRFCSAFLVMLPITKDQIVSVTRLDNSPYMEIPVIKIDEYLK